MVEVDGLESLRPVERKLVEYVERGELLDLVGGQPIDDDGMVSWGKSRTVRASVIRDVLLGRLVDVDPHGLRLRGARIAGRLDLENITATVWLELYQCLLDQGLNARDANLAGIILSGCRLQHRTSPPLDAARLTTTLLNLNQASVEGHNARGALNVQRADLGLLDCDGMRVYNDSGPALFATNLRVHYDLFLRNVSAKGAGGRGAIRLIGAHIGSLHCSRARICNDSGPALLARHARVDREARLDEFEMIGAGEKNTTVDLRNVQIGGLLVFDPARLDNYSNPQARLNIDGLVYSGLPEGIPAFNWLRLLRKGTSDYAAQPYQHLSMAYRAAGHDRESRRILMAQRRDQLQRRDLTGRGERAWIRLTGLALGYGYQPWRALLGLLMVIIVAVVLAIILGGQGGLTQANNPAAIATPVCTLVERVGVGLDLGTPLVTTGARAHCEATSTSAGQILTVTGWVLRLLAWAFATLFIAGFTSAVRKT